MPDSAEGCGQDLSVWSLQLFCATDMAQDCCALHSDEQQQTEVANRAGVLMGSDWHCR